MRLSAAFLRRRRSVHHGSALLLPHCRRYRTSAGHFCSSPPLSFPSSQAHGRATFLSRLTSLPPQCCLHKTVACSTITNARARALSSLAAAVALPPCALATSRRFEASDFTPTNAAAPAGSTTTATSKARHRRGAHRKRGGGATTSTADTTTTTTSEPTTTSVSAGGGGGGKLDEASEAKGAVSKVAQDKNEPLLAGTKGGGLNGDAPGQHLMGSVVDDAAAAAAASVGAPPSVPRRKMKRNVKKRRGGSAEAGATSLEDAEQTRASHTTHNVAEGDKGVVGIKTHKSAVDSGASVTAEDGDDEAASIMMELIASSPLGNLNGHSSKTAVPSTQTRDPVVASAKEDAKASKKHHQQQQASPTPSAVPAEEAVVQDVESDADVVGVELKNHRRNSRTRSSKRRRGSQDGKVSHAESVEAATPQAPSAPITSATTKRVSGVVEAAEDEEVRRVPTSRTPTAASTPPVVAAPAAAPPVEAVEGTSAPSDDDTVDAATHTRKRKGKRGRKSSRSPSASSTADTTASAGAPSPAEVDEAVHPVSAIATPAASDTKRGIKAEANASPLKNRGQAEEDDEVDKAVAAAMADAAAASPLSAAAAADGGAGKASTETPVSPPSPPSSASAASSAATAPPATAPDAPRPLSTRRARRGKRGRASVPHDTHAQLPTAAAVAAAPVKRDEAALKASATQRAPVDVKDNVMSKGDPIAAAVAAAAAEDVKKGATTAAAAVPVAPVTEAAEGATKSVDGSGTDGKKRRGRKKKQKPSPAAAAAVQPIENVATTAAAPPVHVAEAKAATPAAKSVDAAEDVAGMLASDAHLPKSTAAALKKLLAAGAHVSSSGNGNTNTNTNSNNITGHSSGTMSSLAAKKRLAAQIIRRRWQLQQESKGRRAAAALSSSPAIPKVEAPESAEAEDDATLPDVESVTKQATAPARASTTGSPKPATATQATAPTAENSGESATEATGTPRRKKSTRRSAKRRGSVAAGEGEKDTVSENNNGSNDINAGVAGSGKGEAAAVPLKETAPPRASAAVHADDAAEAARDAEVAAAVKAAIALAAMPEAADLSSDEAGGSGTAGEGAAAGVALDASEARSVDGATTAATTVPATSNTSRSLATLVARSQNVVTSAAARLSAAAAAASAAGAAAKSSKQHNSHHSGGSGSGSSSSGSGGNKGANSKDTLYYPDYRERVVQIFEQMAEINGALGERYKALSYSNSVERLKRGDKVFQLLPPNLLPLPEDSPKWTPPVFDATTPEAVMAVAQRRAREVEENRAKRRTVLSSDNLIPGVGQKLRLKIAEILETGDLQELHKLEAKPLIRAIRELTQVHGFGPRTAIEFFKKYNITTVKELQDYAVKKGELDMNNKATGKPAGLTTSASNAHRAGFHLNDAQRLGLVYYKDMCHRIPHDEGRLHEAFMKLRLRKYLGKDYELVVCGSYRRQVEASGDIDVLITRKRMLDGNVQSTTSTPLPPAEVLGTFLEGLKTDRYIEATLAQGPTKFMGLCRLRALPPPSSSPSASSTGKAAAGGATLPRFRARRLDIRYVDVNCFPAAMLYFTGSKNFNVIMRSEAIKKRCILNEYGLFRKFARKQQLQRQAAGEKPHNLHEMITRLARFGFASIKEIIENNGNIESAASEESEESAAGSSVLSAGKKIKKKSKEKTKAEIAELCEVAKIVERQRVKAHTEKEIFDALDMDYVQPKDRNV